VLTRARTAGERIEPVAEGELPLEILCMVVGTFTVDFALIATGYWIYGRVIVAVVLTLLALAGVTYLFRLWNRLKADVADEAHEVVPAGVSAE
jgi:hypothetical protein